MRPAAPGRGWCGPMTRRCALHWVSSRRSCSRLGATTRRPAAARVCRLMVWQRRPSATLASRNLDPQLHTHAVIANMTRGRDGGWRSAEFTSVERSKLLIGAYYRNELRTRLEKIGYATVPTLVGRMPGFEIAGYQRPMLDAFSTRRRELLDYMRDRGWENTPARTQQAALYTRRRKAERDRDAARGRDGVRAAASPVPEPRELPSALAVVRRAVEHLEERRTVFSANDLRAWALAHGGRPAFARSARCRHRPPSSSPPCSAQATMKREKLISAASARRAISTRSAAEQ